MANILNLLGPIMLGIAVAGILLFLKRVLKLPIPGWMIPTMAALGIMGGHIYNDYTWFERFASELPERVEVVETAATSNSLEPWTLIWPRTNRFTVIDAGTVKTNPEHPDLTLGEVVIVERYTPTVKLNVMADCAGNRTATLPANAIFGADGMPEGVRWIDTDPANPVLATLCRLTANANPS